MSRNDIELSRYPTWDELSEKAGKPTTDVILNNIINSHIKDKTTYKRPYEESEETANAKKLLTDNENAIAEMRSSIQVGLDDFIRQYQNREPFEYDMNSDALYQQYKNQAVRNGKLAAEDTMARAAAMTGGYGNSYAQTAGQQAYQQSLDSLNDVIPELYNLAYSKYKDEGDSILKEYSLFKDKTDSELSALLADRDYLQGNYDTERGLDLSLQSGTGESTPDLSVDDINMITGMIDSYVEGGDAAGLNSYLQMMQLIGIPDEFIQSILAGRFDELYPTLAPTGNEGSVEGGVSPPIMTDDLYHNKNGAVIRPGGVIDFGLPLLRSM